MCGLLAFVAAVAGAEPPSSGHAAAEAIAQASHLMRHRGPDEPGTWADPAGTVVFGFNRLSIIDIAHSHQPLRWGPPESPGRYTEARYATRYFAAQAPSAFIAVWASACVL